MALYRTKYASATAAIDWHDLKASGQPLNGVNDGAVVVRTDVASRIAVGVTDPGVSGSAGIATVAGEGVTVLLGAAAANQTIWIMTPADQSNVGVEVDPVATGPVLGVFA